MKQFSIRQLVLAALFASLTAVAAQLRFDLGPVPITGQTFAVLLTGMLLGGRLGALSMGVYLLLGAAGAPVFAGGAAGLTALFGKTGGYLLGYVPAAYLAGRIAESRPRLTWPAALLGGLVAHLPIYAFGVTWLAVLTGQGLAFALKWGLYPFVAGDLIKLTATAFLAVPVRNRLADLGLL